MKPYHKTRTRRQRRVPNQISGDYWQAFRSLYGDRKSKSPLTKTRVKTLGDLTAEKMQKALP